MPDRPVARAAAGEAFLSVLRARRPDLNWELVEPDEARTFDPEESDLGLLHPPDDEKAA